MDAFADRLADAVRAKGTPLLVGLDPRFDSLPEPLRSQPPADAYLAFCRGVIDVVAPLVAAVKPQAAFFEQQGPAGMQTLLEVIRYAREKGLLVVLDGKRNDIGSTAQGYASAYLGHDSAWGCDALTVSPYLGDDSLEPFVRACRENDAGIFVLVKTSNPGGGAFQDRVADGQTIYRHVARHVDAFAAATCAGGGRYGAVGAVVGATYPDQLAELRAAMPNSWLLVPGFGAQGGGAADVKAAFDNEGLGAIINSSRAIIFAHARDEFARFGDDRWQQAVEAATQQAIEQLRSETPAARLVGA